MSKGFQRILFIYYGLVALEKKTRRQLSRGSGLWVDECNEGGHARNRKALEGQKRDDACGFWDVQGARSLPLSHGESKGDVVMPFCCPDGLRKPKCNIET